jgi:hypothetical protein
VSAWRPEPGSGAGEPFAGRRSRAARTLSARLELGGGVLLDGVLRSSGNPEKMAPRGACEGTMKKTPYSLEQVVRTLRESGNEVRSHSSLANLTLAKKFKEQRGIK